LHHSNLPKPWKTSPHLLRGECSYPVPAAASKNKKFRHVPHFPIIRNLRTSLHQCEPCELAIEPDEERVSIGFTPVQWK
jgi:hypothetical protein